MKKMTTNEVIIFIVIIDELECKGYFNIIKQLTHVNNFKKILIKNKKKIFKTICSIL